MSQNTLMHMDFIDRYPPYCEYYETWPVQGRMLVRLGLADVLPPEGVRSSIMTILLDSQNAVYYQTPMVQPADIAHLLIGGRPGRNETFRDTIIREVGEETGYHSIPFAVLGYRHFHQLDPRSPESDRPYPDFIQPILLSRALVHDESLLIADDVLPGVFVDFAVAYAHIHAEQRDLLDRVEEVIAEG